MQSNLLVRVNKYESKIKELPKCKRITVDYPLLCQEEVAKKLATVANNLPKDLFLQIDSAYRTNKTQQILWNARKNVIPELVHNPTRKPSPHSTGGAIDVSLVNSKGKEINLSEPFVKYYEEPQLISNKISPKAQKLRNFLNKVMLDIGFAPNINEYWHFSYGENNWADFKKTEPIYEKVELNSKQYYPFHLRIYHKIMKRFWKLFNKMFNLETNY